MAEFGENVRRLREAKGLTQQSLADELYVTRQAVSRWEGGSRYPDLMTAKKLASALGSTMDALLADDDMKQYAQRAPVLESPKARNAQTAVLAFGFAAYLAMLSWYFFMDIGVLFGPDASPHAWVEALRRFVMAGMFGYGTLLSIRDRLTPRAAVAIAAIHFGAKAASQLLYILPPGNGEAYIFVGLALVAAAGGGVCGWYFLRGGCHRPLPVYAVCAVSGALRLAVAVTSVTGSMGTEFGDIVYINSVIALLAELATLALLCVMARTLYRKRRRAAL